MSMYSNECMNTGKVLFKSPFSIRENVRAHLPESLILRMLIKKCYNKLSTGEKFGKGLDMFWSLTVDI